MINNSAIAQGIRWRSRPLCCRYLLLQIEDLSVLTCEAGLVRNQAVHWGLGMLADGQCEVLGAWLGPASVTADRSEMFDDLKVRGVEKIRFIVGNDREAVRLGVSTAYPGATVLPSPGQLRRQSLGQVAPRHRTFGGEALGAVCEAGTVQAARAAVNDLAAGPWGATYPAVVDRWRDAVEELGPFYALGPRLRRLVRSGDEIAQQMAETLQRAVARQGCFPSEEAAIAFVSNWLYRVDRGFGTAGPVTGHGAQSRVRHLGHGFAVAGGR